jgi:hypothetical protein
MYSSTLSLTSALDGVDGQRHASATLPSGKTQHPLYRRLGKPQGRSGREGKITPPSAFDRIVQAVASRYTDRAIPAHPMLRATPIMKKTVDFCENLVPICQSMRCHFPEGNSTHS